MRSQLTGEKSILRVYEWRFKYMAEGSTWELHTVSVPTVLLISDTNGKVATFPEKIERRHPPGRKVYQGGAHTIWEVGGAKEKVGQLNDPCLVVSPSWGSPCSSIVKNFHCLGSSSSMPRCSSLIATIVRTVPSPALQASFFTVFFYIMMDANSQQDHVLGFFSKVVF